jgi:hypothetical protein
VTLIFSQSLGCQLRASVVNLALLAILASCLYLPGGPKITVYMRSHICYTRRWKYVSRSRTAGNVGLWQFGSFNKPPRTGWAEEPRGYRAIEPREAQRGRKDLAAILCVHRGSFSRLSPCLRVLHASVVKNSCSLKKIASARWISAGKMSAEKPYVLRGFCESISPSFLSLFPLCSSRPPRRAGNGISERD